MNDRYLFRIWDNEIGNYISGYGEQTNLEIDVTNHEKQSISIGYFIPWCSCNARCGSCDEKYQVEDIGQRFLLEQSTTKKASNGIMYEGDIVKGKNGKIWKIVWNKADVCFQFVAISMGGKPWNEKILLNKYLTILQKAKLDFSYLTIIGNVHD